MSVTMYGIYIDGQKATFHPEDILTGDASAYTEEIGTAVNAWMEENVTGGEQVTDTTLTLSGVPADAKVTGDEIGALKEDLIDRTPVETLTVPFDNSTYVVYETGAYYTGSTGAKCTRKVMISGFKSITVFAYIATTAALVAFYDKDGNYLKNISVQANGSGSGQRVDIDLTAQEYSDAYYVVASNYPSVVQAYCILTPKVDVSALDASAIKLLSIAGSDYNNNLASVDKTGFFGQSTFTDLPTAFPSCLVSSYRYSTNYALQIAYNVTTGFIATRIVNFSDGTVYRDWKIISTDDYEYCRILCVGDSIAYGMRNDLKGFVGDLGVEYANKAISQATISNYSEPNLRSIPRQLDEAYGNIPFYPDNIIAEGGINDYGAGVPLGTMSTRPVGNDTEASALDRDTVIGATEYLFYRMIKLYPKAHRFFLITHKTLAYPYTNNSAGYNQQDLHDALVRCCKLYNVEIIDVYEESVINTQYSAYVSDVAWSTDPDTANNAYVDVDGVHPCEFGYAQGYVPLVKRALKIGVRNH